MGSASKFKQHIRKAAIKKVIVLIAEGAILFIIALMLVTFVTNETNATNNLNMIKDSFLGLYHHNEVYLMSDETITLAKEILLNDQDDFKFENEYRQFNSQNDVTNQIILCDTKWNIKYTSYTDEELTSYLHNYNSAICNNAKKHLEKDFYNATYFSADKYSDYMFVKAIINEGEIVGYLSLYLSGNDWHYYMSELNFDGVIADERGNIVFFNRVSLITNSYKFDVEESKISYIGEERYWLKYESLADYDVIIYSFVYYPKNFAFLIGVVVIIIMGILWYDLAKQMAGTMADRNSTSINKLVSEIRIIRKKDHNHRVNMETKDEFEEVAYQINYMLDNILELNIKNTELLKLNNIIEMNQLTAQLNPHFLYNTLEIIRNLVLFDQEKAEKLIIQLTKILRYSINNTKRDVRLEEDLEYINDYIAIQKSRFGDSFKCNINITEECKKCMVPILLLQPIIENSIKYGFRSKSEISIDIEGYMKNNSLYMKVKDDCGGMSSKNAEKLNNTLISVDNNTESNGLYNIARRLILQYGSGSKMEIVNEEGKGLTIIVLIVQT